MSQVLLFLNASLNFCLYSLVSQRYRALLRRTLKGLCGLGLGWGGGEGKAGLRGRLRRCLASSDNTEPLSLAPLTSPPV